MSSYRIALLVMICAATACAQAVAALPNGGRGAGTWESGEFSEPRYVDRWGFGTLDQEHECTVKADTSVKAAGDGSILFDTGSGFDAWAYFPNTKDLDLDASAYSSFVISLRTENKNGWGGSDPWIVFKDRGGRSAQYGGTDADTGKQYSPGGLLARSLTGWVDIRLPVGQSAANASESNGWRCVADPGFEWAHVASVEVHADTGGYGYRMWLDGARFEGGRPTSHWFLSSLEKPDLTVSWAEQLPRYRRYAPTYENGYPELPAGADDVQHWPKNGEKVRYVVHIRNVGRVASPPTDFRCDIAGKRMKTATVPALQPREETTIEVPWTWRQGPFPFEARVDTNGRLDEISRKNNALLFHTDAYTLAAFCEEGMTRRVDAVNNSYGSFSFEDWLRGATVDTMNRLFRHSRYDFAPEGVKASVRIGRVVVVDKITDDVEKGPAEGTYDGSWKYPTTSATEYRNLANSYMWALCHELTHQLGIIDDYNLNLAAKDNHVNGMAFDQPNGGMMGGGDIRPNTAPAYANLDVAGLNLTYPHRRGYFGEYLYAIPDHNTVALTLDGRPLANAEVEVYQKGPGSLSGPPVQTGTTDSNGRLALTNRAVKKVFTTATGMTLKPNPFGHIDVVGNNGVLMMRARRPGEGWSYAFLPITDFVVEYARGHRGAATYAVAMKPEPTPLPTESGGGR